MNIQGAVVISLLGIFYFFYTLSYAIYFYKTANIFFNKQLKIFHLIMIWIIPFIWIFILKAVLGPYNNRFQKSEKDADNSNPEEAIYRTDAFYSFFHESSNSASNAHASNDSAGHNWQGHDSYDNGGHHGDHTDTSGGHH